MPYSNVMRNAVTFPCPTSSEFVLSFFFAQEVFLVCCGVGVSTPTPWFEVAMESDRGISNRGRVHRVIACRVIRGGGTCRVCCASGSGRVCRASVCHARRFFQRDVKALTINYTRPVEGSGPMEPLFLDDAVDVALVKTLRTKLGIVELVTVGDIFQYSSKKFRFFRQ